MSMTKSEIAEKAEALRGYAGRIEDPTFANYKTVLKGYKRILNDTLVLIRELAWQEPAPPSPPEG
jgi:hypothetical protein